MVKKVRELNSKLEEHSGGITSYGSGVTLKDGYSCRIGVICYAEWTLTVNSVTNNTKITIGKVHGDIRPLKLTILTASGVGGTSDKHNPCTCWITNDMDIYLIPKFTDTGATISISGCWRWAT